MCTGWCRVFLVVLLATPLSQCSVTCNAQLARHTLIKSWPSQMCGTRKEVLAAKLYEVIVFSERADFVVVQG